MKNELKTIIILGVILIIGILSGFLCTYKYLKDNSKEENTQENLDIKESPYTLEELYAIVDDPVLFYENNSADMTSYNTVMFNFYDYFSESTPVKIASKVRKNNKGLVIEVLETKYINYSEYMDLMESAYSYASSTKEFYESDNLEPQYNYSLYIDRLVYSS